MKCKKYFKRKYIETKVKDYARFLGVPLESVEIGNGKIVIKTKWKKKKNNEKIYLLEKYVYEAMNEDYVVIILFEDEDN